MSKSRSRRAPTGSATQPPDEPPLDRAALHRFVAAWLQAADDAAATAHRLGQTPSGPLDGTALGRRALRLRSELLIGTEARGWALAHPRGELRPVWAVIAGQRVDFYVYEREQRRRIPLTAKELRQPSNLAPDRRWRQVTEPSGRLAVKATAAYGNTRLWVDQPGQPLDAILSEILDGLEGLARAAAAKQVELDDWHRRYEANERRRARQERRAQDEADRWEDLRDLAANWDEAERVRRFLAALETQLRSSPADPAVSAGLQWAWRKANALDPLSETNAATVRGLLRRPAAVARQPESDAHSDD
jgi:hypothetical protein